MADIQQRLVSCVLRLVGSFLKASSTTESMQDIQKSLTILYDYFNKFVLEPPLELIDSQKEQVLTLCSKLEDLERLIGQNCLSIVSELSHRQLTKAADRASTSDVALFTVVGSFYSCFSSFIMRKSCPLKADVQFSLMTKNKTSLIDELMTAAADKVIRELVNEDLPYDKYYTYSVITRLQAPEKRRDTYTQKTRSIIEKIAISYAIPENMLINFICGKCATYVRRDPELVALLHKHITQSIEGKVPSFEEFLVKSGLKDLWESEEVESFSTLFDKYSTKVQTEYLERQIREKHAKRILQEETTTIKVRECDDTVNDSKIHTDSDENSAKSEKDSIKNIRIPAQLNEVQQSSVDYFLNESNARSATNVQKTTSSTEQLSTDRADSMSAMSLVPLAITASKKFLGEFLTSIRPSKSDLVLQSDNSEPRMKARSRTTDPSNRQRAMYSIVPDSAVLQPICRPDKHGSAGKIIEIYTNHFRVSIDDININQYNVEITRIHRNGKSCPARENERWETLQQLAKQNQKFPIVLYDEADNRYKKDSFIIYTKELLTDFTTPHRIIFNIDSKEKTFEFKVLDLVRQVKNQNIYDFIDGKTLGQPRDSIQIIDSLFKQNVRNDCICIRNKLYERQQQLQDIGDGRGIASGYHQRLCLTSSGPTLNLNLIFQCFYLPLNFVDFACRSVGKDITRCKTAAELEGIKPILRNLLVETVHTGRPIRYRVQGFGKPANQLKFDVGIDSKATESSSAERITVADYFAKRYKPLLYPHLLCIDARKGNRSEVNWLPMEVVKVAEWESAFSPSDSKESSSASKITVVKPDRRYDRIMNIIHQRDFRSDPYLKALNIKVNTEEMMKINARILQPPVVKYRGKGYSEVAEQVSVGRWTIRNRFYATPTIKIWGMIYFGPKPDNRILQILDEFEEQLPPILAKYGIEINSKPVTIVKPDLIKDIDDEMSEASGQGWQLAIIVLNNTRPEVYEYVKQCGNQRLGLITQCVNFQSLERNSGKLRLYIENLSQKINVKLGGINGVVNLKAALMHVSDEDLFMFFGANISHTISSIHQPSIASVVGSCDPTGSRYAARLCKQNPMAGGCSIEIIKGLDKMVTDLLQVFTRNCGNRLPNKIIFYRDGVNDKQIQTILDNEVNKIKNACRISYGNKPLPKLTFIIVNKRHSTRFFVYNGQSTVNIEAGTVIDQDITSPSQFDFYLCSQAALLGTSCPAHYHVLHDEIGFSSDEIQQLTYWLCHTDARCTKSVSLPTPVHYARLAVNAAHAYDFNNKGDRARTSNDNIDEIESLSLEDIETRVMILNDKIQDNMWFV